MAKRAGKRRSDGTVGDRLTGKRVCICLGAGGVGKTTTSAAIALGLAARGKKVAVVTIDPAARLASALGLERLSASSAGSIAVGSPGTARRGGRRGRGRAVGD